MNEARPKSLFKAKSNNKSPKLTLDLRPITQDKIQPSSRWLKKEFVVNNKHKNIIRRVKNWDSNHLNTKSVVPDKQDSSSKTSEYNSISAAKRKFIA